MAAQAAATLTLEDLKKRPGSDEQVKEYGDKYEAKARKAVEESMLTGMSMFLLGVSVATSMYAMKVMGTAGIDALSDGSDDSDSVEELIDTTTELEK